MGYEIKNPSSLQRPWPTPEIEFFASELYALYVSTEAESVKEDPEEKRNPPSVQITRTIPEEPKPFLAVREARLAESRAASAAPITPVNFKGPPSTPVQPIPEPNFVRPRKQSQPERSRVTPFPAEEEAKRSARATPEEPEKKPYPQADDEKSPKKPIPGIKPNLDIGDFARPPGGGGGNSTYMGKVMSGTGNTYQVNLYLSGPDDSSNTQPVQVKIPQIDPSDKISPDTWLTGIILFTDSSGNPAYYCQPAIWMP